VAIATPDAFHARQLLAASRAGIRGAVVEAPAFLTAAEARTVEAECDARGMRVLVCLDETAGFDAVPSETPPWTGQQRTASAADAVRSAFARRAALLVASGNDDPPDAVADRHARLLAAGAGGDAARASVWRGLRRLLDGGQRDDARQLSAAVAHLTRVEAELHSGEPTSSTSRSAVCFGAGVMGAVHAGLAATHARVLRVASRSAASAEPVALLVGADSACASQPGVLHGADSAVICTPPRSHFAYALAAVEAGCDVLVEKPMTATVGEARRLAQAVDARGVRFVYGENWAYQPAVERAVEVFREMGVDQLEVTAHWPMPQWLPLESAEYGGAAVFDGAPHLIELVRLLLGRPRATRVTATLDARGSQVDLAATLQVDFEGGAHASITVDLVSEATEVTARAHGVELRLAPDVELRARGRMVAVDAGPPHSWTALGYAGQMRALFGAEPVRAGVHDGLAVMEIIAAAYLSAGRGAPVPLPYEGPLDCTPLQLWRGAQAP
jgi:predicted dehydrogenase